MEITHGSSNNSGGGVSSLSVVGDVELTGDITLSEGANITLTQVGNDIQVAASGGGAQTFTASGDATAPGSTSNLALTLATVNANVGSFGLAGSVAQFTVNAKGLITAAANVAISITASAVSDFSAAVRAATLTGLSLVSTTVISATDTVLVALGSLQAQITALTTTVGTKADKTTTISTTAPLSGGGDLSANRILTTSMATNKLIGRGTAGTGTMEEITLGTNLSLSGTTLNAAGGASTVSGQATVNFGASSQEDSYATVTVSTASVFSASVVTVSPSGVATADHDPDDYQWDNISGYVANIINGVSFDLIGVAPNGSFGDYKLNYVIN